VITLAPSDPLIWAAPRPLWQGASSPGLAPVILRFASDAFMEQLIAVLEHDPTRLADYVALPETWRTPMGTPLDATDFVPLPGPMKAARRQRRLKLAPQLPTQPAMALKLFQPAHQRYYIACATLACAIPGLPDRRPAGGQEQLAMVIRRLLPAKAGERAGALVEYAFVNDASGSSWQLVSEGDGDAVLAPGEEQLPVFPLAHADSDAQRRALWGGLIPVARREAYLGAPISRVAKRLFEGQLAALGPAKPPPPRMSTLARSSEFRIDVIEPWKAMIRSALAAADDIRNDATATDSQRQSRVREANLRLQMQAWLVLSDLARVLRDHLAPVAAAITASSNAGLTGYREELYEFLVRELAPADAAALTRGLRPAPAPGVVATDARPYRASIAAALRELTQEAIDSLDAATTFYQGTAGGAWPGFHSLLAGVGSDGGASTASIRALGPFRFVSGLGDADQTELLNPPSTVSSMPPETGFDLNDLERLATLFGRCLTPEVESSARPMPYAQQLAQTMADTVSDQGLFCLRFVHLNEDCGPLHPPTLSAPSASFELAGFFDAEAPARPLRISLPLDASPAGLRKHARGTAFVLSDMLCGQVQRAKALGLIDLIRQVLPWPLHKEIDIGDGGGCKNGNGIDIGMVCSLSIPIITICALILLMIIVSLLDFIFRWLPWFVICFPVPRLRAKGARG
jgi:hypothetical protein